MIKLPSHHMYITVEMFSTHVHVHVYYYIYNSHSFPLSMTKVPLWVICINWLSLHPQLPNPRTTVGQTTIVSGSWPKEGGGGGRTLTRPVGLSPAVANIHTYNQKSTLILRYILCTIVHCIKCLLHTCNWQIDYLRDTFNSGYLILQIWYPSHLNNSEDDSDIDYVD